MNMKGLFYYFSVLLMLLSVCVPAYSGSEGDLYTFYTPQALIVLDLSGSMDYPPSGNILYASSETACDNEQGPFYAEPTAGYTYPCDLGQNEIYYSSESCSVRDGSGNLNPYYLGGAPSGYNTNCTKRAIAKRAIFNILDANGDNVVSSLTDDNQLAVDIGYRRFYGCNSGNLSSCNQLVHPLGTPYSRVVCNSSTSCSNAMCGLNDSNYICSADSSGGTPLAESLQKALTDLTNSKNSDSTLGAKCRARNIILITDGSDTFFCGGNGQDFQAKQHLLRQAVVAAAKALKDDKYNVYVIGFGSSMPFYLKNTLNWAAFYGGTNNASDPDVGAVDPASFIPPSIGGNFCNTSQATTCYQYACDVNSKGLTCPTPTYEACTCNSTSCDNCFCFAENDPGGNVIANSSTLSIDKGLSGYAYIAGSSDELETALSSAFASIKGSAYAFAGASISTARIASENHIYEASFTFMEGDAFWQGHVKKFGFDSSGQVSSSPLWDAGQVLANGGFSRPVYTRIDGTMRLLDSSNVTITHLGLSGSSAAARATEIKKFVVGDPSYNKDGWKLGDIFHSNPVVISSPSVFFKDPFDLNTPSGFESFRASHQRPSGGGRVVAVGANDGQLHIFDAGDGSEITSFVTPNLLPKLNYVAHTHLTTGAPTGGSHRFFLDGPITAGDVWLGSDGTHKSASDWQTLLVAALGRGGDVATSPEGSYLWSRNSSCTPTNNNTAPEKYGLTDVYDATHPNYCGYWAFDLTQTTLNPINVKWVGPKPSAAQAPYLGEPWSKMAMGRINYNGVEKWVGFVGGGGWQYQCTGSNNPTPPNSTIGRGLFVVDLTNGNVLQAFTGAGYSDLNPVFAPPAIADTNNDGFVDVVYFGDYGGNMWRLKYDSTNWSLSKFYNQTTGSIRPIYGGAAVAKDTDNNVWVFWGTGDRQCPTDPNAQEIMFAVKDDMQTTVTKGSLQNITSSGQLYDDYGKKGWYMEFSGHGEKVEGDPVVFAGTLFFTVYTPASGGSECNNPGSGSLFGVNFLNGQGVFSNNSRSISVGEGIPSSPQISLSPTSGKFEVFVTNSGGLSVAGGTHRVLEDAGGGGPASKILWWKDRRIQ